MANRFQSYTSADHVEHFAYRVADLVQQVRRAVALGRSDDAFKVTRLLYRASGAHQQAAYWFDKDMRAEMQ